MKYVFAVCLLFLLSTEASKSIIWHITDTHLQADYYEGADPLLQCSAGKGKAGKFGDYHCREPYNVEKSAFDSLASLAQKPSFIFWTGDSVSRFPNQNYSYEGVKYLIENITKVLSEASAKTGARVFPAIGNHDSFPQHQMPINAWWVYDLISDLWPKSFGLSNESIKTLKKGGYYSEVVNSKLKIISLNTILYYYENNAVPLSDPDPAGQISWMREQLVDSKLKGQTVWIIGHLPPNFLGGFDDAYHLEFNDLFLRGLEGFHEIIKGSFWGHIHLDWWQLIGNTSISNGFHPGFYAGHLGGDIGINPNFRSYEFDSNTFDLIDWKTFYMNITEANQIGKINWWQLYQASEFYGIPDISSKSMLKAFTKVKTSQSMFKKMSFYAVGGGPSDDFANLCNSSCVKKWLCATSTSWTTDFENCIKTPNTQTPISID